VLKLEKNCGKGGAVRKGMMRARGNYLLFADADGATKVRWAQQAPDAVQFNSTSLLHAGQ
jgi:cellulose synthase/poly-beta-1,6-N-acetylglucosamine synthase-like glycosyltransferase